MRQTLQLHPDGRCAAVKRIEVVISRLAGARLEMLFILIGDTRALRLPPFKERQRADELWRTTCFEVFVRAPPGEAYRELNFSPSTQWAAYGFSAYRTDMRVALEIEPEMTVLEAPDRLDVCADVQLDLPADALWRIALSAVIEEANGDKSYWALAHPPGKPDFHHADGFALDLPAPEPA